MDLVDVAIRAEIFRGYAKAELESLLLHLNATRRLFRKGESVVNAGLPADRLLVVVSGRLHAYEQVRDGRMVLMREIGTGEVIGLWILHVPAVTSWPGTIVAAEDTLAIRLSMENTRQLLAGHSAEAGHLAVNAARLLSRELFSLWHKLAVMDGQTIESRIEIYLSELDNETGHTGVVTVPFNRERMAEYFGVTRPALSRSLGHLRDRGLLTWTKNTFRINF